MADNRQQGQPGRPAQAAASNPVKKKAPDNETKSAKFIRLGNYRVVKAVEAIQRIGHLSGSSYEYTPEQVAKLRKVLTDSVTNVMGRFDKTTAKAEIASIL